MYPVELEIPKELNPEEYIQNKHITVIDVKTRLFLDTSNNLSFPKQNLFEKQKSDFEEVVRKLKVERKHSDLEYIDKANGDEEKAMKMWLKESRKRAKRLNTPQWLKDARNNV